MNDLFPILAVETSGELCSIALLLDGKRHIELNYSDKHIHSQKLMGMIDSVINSSPIELNDLKSIAVSMGPGSFTGLRIGLSAAKGIAFGLNLPIIPVPTFNALAHHAGNYIQEGIKFTIAVSANMEEIYFSRFIRREERAEVLEELKLIEKKDLHALLGKDEIVLGDWGVGKAANTVSAPGAKSIGEWAYLYGKDLLTFEYDYLEPNYFKKFIVKAGR